MATHPNILVWKIPVTEGPGGLQSMGSQRVGHNLVTKNNNNYYGKCQLKAQNVVQWENPEQSEV